jgi:type II secretory pathway component PulC
MTFIRSSFAVALLALSACSSGGGASSSSSAARPPAAAGPPATSAKAEAEPTTRPGHLPRAAVLATLSQGLGAFLSQVDTEPVLVSGRFHGWRIVRLAESDPQKPFWKGVDLGPGDIVTSVNGRPIERPEQALTAFQSLAMDPQLRVAYERNGKRRELVYLIDDPKPR